MGEVMQETLMMIPDCHRRLLTAHSDLSNLLETEAELNVDGEVEEFVATVTLDRPPANALDDACALIRVYASVCACLHMGAWVRGFVDV